MMIMIVAPIITIKITRIGKPIIAIMMITATPIITIMITTAKPIITIIIITKPVTAIMIITATPVITIIIIIPTGVITIMLNEITAETYLIIDLFRYIRHSVITHIESPPRRVDVGRGREKAPLFTMSLLAPPPCGSSPMRRVRDEYVTEPRPLLTNAIHLEQKFR